MGERGSAKPKLAATLFSLPSSRLGKWSASLLGVSLLLVVLNVAVVQPATERRVELETIQTIYNILVGLCVVAAGGSGLFALVAKRERSWIVLLAVLLLGAVIVLMVQDLATPGQ